MTNKSPNAFMSHLSGMSAILNAIGVQGLQSDSSRRTFYEFRAIWLPIALSIRKSSYMSSSKWINPPWKRMEPLSSSKLHTVIDLGFQIPGLMEKFDKIQGLGKNFSASNYIACELSNLMIKSLALQEVLEKWENKARGEEDIQLYMPRLARYADDEKPYPISFTFRNWDDASSLVYLEMLRIFLFELLMDIAAFARNSNTTSSTLSRINESDLTRRSLESADTICQSLEWFLEDHKRLIGRMMVLAPFKSAKGVIAKASRQGTGDVEQDRILKKKTMFCDMITKQVKDSGSSTWNNDLLSSGNAPWAWTISQMEYSSKRTCSLRERRQASSSQQYQRCLSSIP